MKINVIFYSLYGHIYRMAEAAAAGAREVEDAEVGLYQIQETFTPYILEKMGAIETKKLFSHIPVATIDKLAEADGIIFGVPTRFGMIPSHMQAFIDRTGGLWPKGGLVDKVSSIFTSSATQHDGQKSTILGFSTV
jgi:NAD(P)H dehydrogenase (quinone)